MKRFIQGISRDQGTLFPEYLEDFVTEDNPVRVVDVFVEQLDLNQRQQSRSLAENQRLTQYHLSGTISISFIVL